jgi:rod shape determining protein RodA
MDRGLDRPLAALVAVLLSIGLATLYSAGQTDVLSPAALAWQRQLVFVGLGFVLAIIMSRVSLPILEWATPYIYFLAVGLLVLTLIAGTGAGTAAGTKSWLAIGGVRLGQPSELAKLATILMLARHLAGRRNAPRNLVELLPACAIVAVPFVLVGLQPDLGSAIVFLGILLAMLFWVGTNGWLLLLLASPGISLMMAFSTLSWGLWIVGLTILILWIRPYVMEGLTVWLVNVGMGVMALELWNRLAPYQQNRLLSFLNPEIDPRATGWHIIQSKVAIGSGGIFGKGYLDGSQKRLAFIPEQSTDFIYTVLGEEWGFLGVVVTLVLFTLLCTTLIGIARRAQDAFACMLVFGFAGMLLTHILENVGMTVGLMPITGIPLPFFSYGGSFMLACLLGLGVVFRVAREGRRLGYGE